MPRSVSYSRVGMFLRCPAQYRFRYKEGLKQRPTGAMTLGSAVDDALTTNYTDKIDTGKDLSHKDVTDRFVASFEQRADETNFEADPGEFRESGQGLCVVHINEWAPEIQPLKVQPKIEVQFPGRNWSVLTFSDLITRDTVFDWKVTGRSPSKDKVTGVYRLSYDHAFQQTLYAMSFRGALGYDPIYARNLYHVRTKTPKIVAADKIVTPEDEQFVVSQIDRVFNQIVQLEDFEKTLPEEKRAQAWVPNRGHMMCSEKGCGFWNVCHETYGPTIPGTRRVEVTEKMPLTGVERQDAEE